MSERKLVMPINPSDEVAQMLSRKSWGFNVGERIADGRDLYHRLRAQIAREHREEK